MTGVAFLCCRGFNDTISILLMNGWMAAQAIDIGLVRIPTGSDMAVITLFSNPAIDPALFVKLKVRQRAPLVNHTKPCTISKLAVVGLLNLGVVECQGSTPEGTPFIRGKSLSLRVFTSQAV
jgi:hypothetical protein